MKNYDKVNTLLFDLDGTLINSEREFYNSFYEVLLKNYKITINEKMYKECELDKNVTLLDTLRTKNKIIQDIPNDKIMEKVFSCYTQKFIEVITSNKTRENFECLKKLKSIGYTLGLVTTCQRKYLKMLIETLNIQELFDCIISREDVKKLKPDCEAYLKALELLGKRHEEVLVIEDSKRGIDAAINSGLKVIKVDEYTLVKFNDSRCLELNSVEDFTEKLLDIKRCI